MKLGQIGKPEYYIWQLSFRRKDSFPVINKLPIFYQDVILSYNQVKSVKPFNKLTKNDVIEQPIWGNEYFRVKNKCLYFKYWIDKKIMYIKDLINNDGTVKTDLDLYNSVNNKSNIFQELYVIKNYVIKRLNGYDLSIAPYVKIRREPVLQCKNNVIFIDKQKNKFFYQMLIEKCGSRPNMESIFSRNFNFPNTVSVWRSIYMQKLSTIKIPKIREFNFKVLNNIVPCGNVLSKWNNHIDDKCKLCNSTESSSHMLYDCKHIVSIWKDISTVLKCNIVWKNIVCGWPQYSLSNKIECLNLVISIVASAIYKENSRCKFNQIPYRKDNVIRNIKATMSCYQLTLKEIGISHLFYHYVDIIRNTL